MATEAFNPEILRSPALLAHFLDGAEETAAILRARQTPATPPLAGRWSVACLAELEEVYHLTSMLVLTVISYLLHGLCMTDLSKRVWVLSRHEQANGTIIKAQKVFQDTLLARSINTHRKDSADFYLQKPMSTTLPGRAEPINLNFFQERGACRGMCHWFVYLYFKTLNQFTDPQEHMRAIGMQFEQGASKQAAFICSLYPVEQIYQLLHLNFRGDYLRINPLNKSHEQLIGEIQQCTPGIYGIYTANHQLVYAKSNDGHQFLFDPNKGTFVVDSPILFKKAMAQYFEKHDSLQEIYIDRYSPAIA
jgi:hypothetical protein